MTKQKLTSVKVNEQSWNNFKKLSIDEQITFRQLVHISIEEFINNESYRKTIKSWLAGQLTYLTWINNFSNMMVNYG